MAGWPGLTYGGEAAPAAAARGAEARGDAEANKNFEALFGEEFHAARRRSAGDRAGLARRFVELVDQGALDLPDRTVLLRKSFELGAMDPEGSEIALLALDRLADLPDADPVRYWIDRLDMRRKHSENARRDQRNELGQRYLDDLLEAIEMFHRQEVVAVTDWCAQAARVAARIDSPDAARVRTLTTRAREAAAAFKQWDRLLARLEARPDDLETRRQAVLLAVASLDRPDWAAGHLTPGLDAALRTRVETLARDLRGATVDEALDVGQWMESLAKTAPAFARPQALRRALAAYRRGRALGETGTLAAAKVDMDIARLEERLAEGGTRPNGRQPDKAGDSGRATDLLAAFSPDAHRVEGRWTVEKDGLRSSADRDARVMLPYSVEGAYRLEVEFATTGPRTTIFLMFPVGNRQTSITLDSFNPPRSGVEAVRRRRVDSYEPPAVFVGRLLDAAKTYRLTVDVAPESKGKAKIACELDRRAIFSWEGPIGDLSLPTHVQLPDKRCFGLGTHQQAVVWKSVVLRPGRGGRAVRLK